MVADEVDHARRRVTVTPQGEVTGPEYEAWLLGLLSGQPAVAGYDFLYDLHAYEGRVGHDDIAALAPKYAALVGDRDRGALTVLVTTDEGFRFWAELFAVQFPNRAWRVVPTTELAEAVLADAAAARGGGGPSAPP